jgi:hypothetical protein
LPLIDSSIRLKIVQKARGSLRSVGVVALVIALGGCGGGASGEVSSEAGRAPTILGLDDFPPGATIVEGLPSEPCGPIGIIEAGGGEPTESMMVTSGRIRVQEAVGTFSNVKDAEAAFEGLNAPERHECIRGAIESFGAGRDEKVTVSSSEEFGVGDKDFLVQLVVTAPGRSPSSYFDVVVIRSGTRVATLAIIVNGGNPATPAVRDVIKRVARQIDSTTATS